MNARRKIRNTCFVIEGLNSFSTVLYFNYLYFFMRSRFGFDDKHNLLLAALLGFVYVFAAWQGGRLAHRFGYFRTLKLGFSVMIVGLLGSLLFDSMSGHILAAIVVSIGMCATWPTLEALVSESTTPDGVPRVVGIYNITWAVANAVAFFIGGTLIEQFGFKVIFFAPIGIVLVQLLLTFWMEACAKENSPIAESKNFFAPALDPNRPSPAKAKIFLRMAWLANPFAYIAINTLIAVVPGIAAKFHLSPMLAGFVCSLWCFVRLGTFILLWRWTDWHYRFRWLGGAFALLILSFAAILLSPNLAVLIGAQIFLAARLA